MQIIKNYIPAYDNSIGWGRLPVIARIHFNQLRRLQAQLLTYSFSVATRDARQRISYAPQMIEAALDKDDKIYDVLQATSRRWTWGEVYKGDDDRLYESLNQILHDPAYSAKDKEEIGVRIAL